MSAGLGEQIVSDVMELLQFWSLALVVFLFVWLLKR